MGLLGYGQWVSCMLLFGGVPGLPCVDLHCICFSRRCLFMYISLYLVGTYLAFLVLPSLRAMKILLLGATLFRD